MRFKYWLLILIVIFVSVLRVWFSLRFSRNYLLGERIVITERLTEQPYQSRSGQYFRLKGLRILAPDFPAYSLGSVLRVEGVVQRSDSKRSFRLLGFSAPDFWLIYPNIDVVTETEASKQRSFLSWERGLGLVYSFRKTIVDDYGKVLPEPHASLLSGIVLGERATMPETFYTRLRETGSLHIIAVSGMNVTIIAGILINSLVLVMSRRKAIIFALLGVVFYAFLAGLSPPVVRAALMGTIAYLSMVFGRERDGLIGLSWVAAAMLLIRPFYLVDVGWQLSVAATLGIILLQAPVKRYILIPFDKIFKEDKGDWGGKESSTKHQASNLKPALPAGRQIQNSNDQRSKSGGRFGIWNLGFGHSAQRWAAEELAVTLSAQTLTLPLIVWHFGIVSFSSPVVNVLLAPVVPVLMLWGGVVAVFGLVSQALGPSLTWLPQVVAWGAWVFLEYFVRVVEAFGRWFGAVEVTPPAGEAGEVPTLMVLGYYLIIAWVIWRIKSKSANTSR